MATTNIQELVAVIFAYFGQIGNAVFIVCSAWFLIDDDKFKLSKVISIILDCLVISVMMLCIFLAFGYSFSIKMIIRQFMPTILGTNWFVTTYLIFYTIHPYINRVIHSISQREHLCINLVLFVFYCIGALIKGSLLYFNKLLGFIVLYSFVAYMKKYMKTFTESKKANTGLLAISIVGLLLMILLTNAMGIYIPFLRNRVTLWCKFWNPVIIAIAISAFNLSSAKVYSNKTVNYLSSLSLLVLCFHANPLVLLYFRYDFFEYIFVEYSYQRLVAWMLAFAAFLAIVSILLSCLYKGTIQKLTYKLGQKYSNYGELLFLRIYNRVEKIEEFLKISRNLIPRSETENSITL